MEYFVIEPSGQRNIIPTEPGALVEGRVLESGSLQVFRRSPWDEEVLGTYVAGSKLCAADSNRV